MPESPTDWFEAVWCAAILRAIELSVAGVGPRIDRERCDYMLAEGRKRGYRAVVGEGEQRAWVEEWREMFGSGEEGAPAFSTE